jgi:signal transduction histidine kinase
MGDPDLIYQAFLNILKNACEACADKNGQVNIKTKLENGQWIAEITDNGHGLDKEATEKAFDPFYTTKAKGTGLGLSFVERVVKVHGGTVAFRKNSPKGTIFKLSFQKKME